MFELVLHVLLALQPGSIESNTRDLLIDGVLHMAPNLDEATAKLHAEAAIVAGWAVGVDPELLLAMVNVESRFEPIAVSRPARGKRFCGVLQVYTPSEAACIAMRDLTSGYLAGALVLRAWLKLARGNLTNALNGYGCGMWGLTHGCRHYAERVRARWRRLGPAG